MDIDRETDTGSACETSDEAFVMPAPALLWLQEFEQANGHKNSAHLWRDLHGKSMRRGSKSLNGLDWPALVHVPSPLLGADLAKGLVKMPARWARICTHQQQAQMLSTLAGWEVDRGVYGMTPRTALLMKHCSVQAPLVPRMFETLPARSLYVSLLSPSEPVSHGLELSHAFDGSAPVGFFASIDQPRPGQLELVLLVDQQTHLDVHAVPLDGKTIDEMAVTMLLRARSQAATSRAWAEAEVKATTSMLHLAISALLMTCINRQRMQVFEAVEENPFVCVRQPWLTWEVGHGIDSQIETEMEMNEKKGRKPMLIGQWCPPLNQETIRLQFAAGCQLNWGALDKKMAGKK